MVLFTLIHSRFQFHLLIENFHNLSAEKTEPITPLTIVPGNPAHSSTFQNTLQREKQPKSFSAPPESCHFVSTQSRPQICSVVTQLVDSSLSLLVYIFSVGRNPNQAFKWFNKFPVSTKEKKVSSKKTFLFSLARCQAMPIWLVFYALQRKTFFLRSRKLFSPPSPPNSPRLVCLSALFLPLSSLPRFIILKLRIHNKAFPCISSIDMNNFVVCHDAFGFILGGTELCCVCASSSLLSLNTCHTRFLHDILT
jgi:hypothetical protein